MTEDLRTKVIAAFDGLEFIVSKNPSTPVGTPTLTVLKELLKAAKDSGGDPHLCDAMFRTLNLSTGTTISASDAFMLAAQLKKIVGAT